MSQITRCPSCATSFKVVPDQLRISEGWVRCGHCQHVFDATQHLQAASPSPPAPPTAPSPSIVQDQSALVPPPTATPEPPAIADPWEIPLPPPPASPSIESAVVAPLDDALDLSTAAPVLPSNIDLEWPEFASPVPAPVVAPPPPAPVPAAAPVTVKEVPTPIPAASIPTDIEWPEPALEFDPDPPTVEPAVGTAPEAEQLPVMPELDLAPTPTRVHLSPDERIEPSGPLDDWATAAVNTAPLAVDSVAADPLEAGPVVSAPAIPPTDTPRISRRKKGKEAAAAPALASTPPPVNPETTTTNNNDEPSFVRAARRQALWRTPAVRVGLVLFGLLLLLTLIGQILVHDRNRLAAVQPSLRPLLELLCSPFDYTVGLHRQIASVVVESSSFNRVDGGVYHFAVTLKNRSDLMLEMPAVELTLTDANEQAVLRRVFTPEELGASTTLAPHAEFSSTLLVRITSSNAPMAGYRILAFYP